MEQFTRRAVLQSGVAAICTSSLPVSRGICPGAQPRSGLPALLPLHEPIWASCSRAFQPASSSNSRFDAELRHGRGSAATIQLVLGDQARLATSASLELLTAKRTQSHSADSGCLPPGHRERL